MPKSRTIQRPQSSSASIAEGMDAPATPLEAARDAADAMYRAACECCHQHDRVARIIARSSVEDELSAAQRLCAECTASLKELSSFYRDVAAEFHPIAADEEWWHRANALLSASREYLRRNSCGDAATRDLKHHDRERLGALHADYELEASAVLALRQAADAYRQSRPAAL